MTIIAAYRTNECVWMAADSQGTRGQSKNFDTKKIIKRRNWICGVCGSSMAINLLEESPDLDFDIHESFQVRNFANGIKQAMIESGAKKEAKDYEMLYHPNEYILSFGNKAYRIGPNYETSEIKEYAACGSGEDLAMGAMNVLSAMVADGELTPKEIVIAAVKAAIKHNVYCGGKINLEKTKAIKL